MYNDQPIGAWLSLVERSVWDREVGGSNPLAPINKIKKLWLPKGSHLLFTLSTTLSIQTADTKKSQSLNLLLSTLHFCRRLKLILISMKIMLESNSVLFARRMCNTLRDRYRHSRSRTCLLTHNTKRFTRQWRSGQDCRSGHQLSSSDFFFRELHECAIPLHVNTFGCHPFFCHCSRRRSRGRRTVLKNPSEQSKT